MQKKLNIYLVASLCCFMIAGCSGNDDPEPKKPDPEKEWDKTRTAKITFVSDLTDNNPFATGNYNAVGSAIKGNDSHILILDKANIVHGPTKSNPGANIAIVADKVPFFVPVSVAESEYKGSAILYPRPVSEIELTVVTDACRIMPATLQIKQGVSARAALLSFDAENQISASSSLFRSAQTSSTLITGTVRRSLIPALESVTSSLTNGTYTLEIMENSNKNSEYAIYLFGSAKWKFRDFTESPVSGNIKSFLLQVEYL